MSRSGYETTTKNVHSDTSTATVIGALSKIASIEINLGRRAPPEVTVNYFFGSTCSFDSEETPSGPSTLECQTPPTGREIPQCESPHPSVTPATFIPAATFPGINPPTRFMTTSRNTAGSRREDELGCILKAQRGRPLTWSRIARAHGPPVKALGRGDHEGPPHRSPAVSTPLILLQIPRPTLAAPLARSPGNTAAGALTAWADRSRLATAPQQRQRTSAELPRPCPAPEGDEHRLSPT